MYDFSLPCNADTQQIVTLFKRWGIVHIPAFLPLERVTALRGEFLRLMAAPVAAAEPIDYPPGTAVAVARAHLDRLLFPCTSEVFDMPFMHDFAQMFCGTDSHLNSHIYCTRDIPRDAPITQVHHDNMFGFKFLIYLTETTAESGAFKYVPGSHIFGRKAIFEHMKKGVPVKDFPCEYPEFEKDAQVVEGVSGTLVIFDTAGLHQGGVVQPGQERWVMRGHCHADPKPDYFPVEHSPQWWMENHRGSPQAMNALLQFGESLIGPYRS